MIRRTLILGGLALLLAAPAARAQHEHETSAFDGRWTLDLGTQMGRLSMDLELEMNEHLIQGIARSSMGGEGLLEGAQDGDDVTFTIFIRQPDHEVDLVFRGTLEGETASGTVDIMGEFFDWTAERAKDG